MLTTNPLPSRPDLCYAATLLVNHYVPPTGQPVPTGPNRLAHRQPCGSLSSQLDPSASSAPRLYVLPGQHAFRPALHSKRHAPCVVQEGALSAFQAKHSCRSPDKPVPQPKQRPAVPALTGNDAAGQGDISIMKTARHNKRRHTQTGVAANADALCTKRETQPWHTMHCQMQQRLNAMQDVSAQPARA